MCIVGQMEESMKESGFKTKCTARVSILGGTAGSMRVNTSTTRSMDMEYILGPTDENMMDRGQMDSEMVVGNTS